MKAKPLARKETEVKVKVKAKAKAKACTSTEAKTKASTSTEASTTTSTEATTKASTSTEASTETNGTLREVRVLDAGIVVRKRGLKAAYTAEVVAATALAAAAWTRRARALAAAAPYLDASSLSALAASGREGYAAVSTLALPAAPPNALNAEASRLLRRVATLERTVGDAVSAAGTFPLRCVYARRLAYTTAMVDLAAHMWACAAAMPLLMPPAATKFVEDYWGNHTLALSEEAAVATPPATVAPAVLAMLLAPGAAVRPVHPRAVAGWLTAWHAVPVKSLDAKARSLAAKASRVIAIGVGEKRPRAACRDKIIKSYRVLEAPWVRHHVHGRAVVGVSDVRWDGDGVAWVHGHAKTNSKLKT